MEQIPSLNSNLDFLEFQTSPQISGGQSIACGLDGSLGGLGQVLQVLVFDAACAEHVAVREVLGGQVADGQLGEHDLAF